MPRGPWACDDKIIYIPISNTPPFTSPPPPGLNAIVLGWGILDLSPPPLWWVTKSKSEILETFLWQLDHYLIKVAILNYYCPVENLLTHKNCVVHPLSSTLPKGQIVHYYISNFHPSLSSSICRPFLSSLLQFLSPDGITLLSLLFSTTLLPAVQIEQRTSFTFPGEFLNLNCHIIRQGTLWTVDMIDEQNILCHR